MSARGISVPGNPSVSNERGQSVTLQQPAGLGPFLLSQAADGAFLAHVNLSLEARLGSGLPLESKGPQDSRASVLGTKGLSKAQRGPETESGPTFRLPECRPQARSQTEGQNQGTMEMISEGPAGIREGREPCSPP